MKIRFVIISLVLLVIISNIAWHEIWQYSQAQKEIITTSLQDSREILDDVVNRFVLTQRSMGTTIEETKNQLRELNISTENSLEALKAQLNIKDIALKDKEADLNELKAELEALKKSYDEQDVYYQELLSVSVNQSREEGYSAGYQAAMDSEVSLHNPTYEELRYLFVTYDMSSAILEKTRKNLGFVCVDYVEVLSRAAAEANIRSAVVFLVYKFDGVLKIGHFINAFEIVDRGLVFIDPMMGLTNTTDMVNSGEYLGDHIREVIFYW